MLINNKGSPVTCVREGWEGFGIKGGLGCRSLPGVAVTVGHTHLCGQPAGGAELS